MITTINEYKKSKQYNNDGFDTAMDIFFLFNALTQLIADGLVDRGFNLTTTDLDVINKSMANAEAQPFDTMESLIDAIEKCKKYINTTL